MGGEQAGSEAGMEKTSFPSTIEVGMQDGVLCAGRFVRGSAEGLEQGQPRATQRRQPKKEPTLLRQR